MFNLYREVQKFSVCEDIHMRRAARSTASIISCSLLFLLSVLIFVRCGSGGGGGSGGTTNNPPPPVGGANQFAYVGNYFGSNTQAFTSDGNGNLTPAGNPAQGLVMTGTHPHNTNVDKAGRFVYYSNHDSNFVSGFRINSPDGTLIPINPTPSSPVTDATDPTNNNPHWSVFDTTAQFLYVIAGVPPALSTLHSYSVNGTTGQLTQIGTTGPLAQCSHGHNVVISPNNKWLYVACQDSAFVYFFQRDTNGVAINGVPTQVTAQNGAPPTAPAAMVDPTSSFLFVGVTNGVTVFNIDPNSGNISGQKVFAAGNFPHSLTLDANGTHLYTANLNDNNISVFSVNAGVLTQLEPAVATGGEPNQVVIHPDGQVLFTDDQTTDTVTRFIVNGNGTLNANGIAHMFPTGSAPTDMGFTNK